MNGQEKTQFWLIVFGAAGLSYLGFMAGAPKYVAMYFFLLIGLLSFLSKSLREELEKIRKELEDLNFRGKR